MARIETHTAPLTQRRARIGFIHRAIVPRQVWKERPHSAGARARAALAAVVLLGGVLSCDILGPGPIGWTQLVASRFLTCGLDGEAGDVYCWGDIPGYSILVMELHPDSVFPRSDYPRRVPTSSTAPFVRVSNQGGTYCAIASDGSAYCGGLNIYYTAGLGERYARRGLGRVIGDHSWASVLGGDYHSCGLTTEGAAYCWGQQAAGSLGNDTLPTFAISPTPLLVSGGHVFVEISKGREFACGLKVSGDAWCWGFHNGMFLGVGESLAASGSGTPLLVEGGHTFVSLQSSVYSTCAITSAREGYCWGRNFNGLLGDGTKQNRGVPTRVAGDHRWRRIEAGITFSCGITTSHALYCWGSNADGQLGPQAPNETLTPFLVASAGRYRDFAVGEAHLCGIRFDGAAECRGRGLHGELGNGARNGSEWPVRVIR